MPTKRPDKAAPIKVAGGDEKKPHPVAHPITADELAALRKKIRDEGEATLEQKAQYEASRARCPADLAKATLACLYVHWQVQTFLHALRGMSEGRQLWGKETGLPAVAAAQFGVQLELAWAALTPVESCFHGTPVRFGGCDAPSAHRVLLDWCAKAWGLFSHHCRKATSCAKGFGDSKDGESLLTDTELVEGLTPESARSFLKALLTPSRRDHHDLGVALRRECTRAAGREDVFQTLRDHVRNTAGNEAQAIPRGQELSPTERVLPSEAHTEVRYVFRRDGDFWTVQFGQEKLPALRHLDGMVYIAHALKNRDGPWSAWQLYQMFKARASEGVSMDEWTMDATDPKAIKACRERLKNIEKELGDARENKQTTRIEKLEQERKKIEKYLSQNQDKWGRPRKLGHKSRTKVRNAIVRARENIKKHSKALWVHLVNDLDTGNQIRYRGHFKWEI